MELFIFQKGFNYAQDGPGNRLVYHLQGCNLRCPWCANPEGLARAGGTACTVDSLVAEAADSRLLFFEGGGVTLTGGEVAVQLDAAKELLTRLRRAGIHTAIETNGLSPRLPELFGCTDYWMIDCKHHDPARHAAVTGQPCDAVFENIRAAAQLDAPLALRIPLIGGFNASAADADAFADRFDALGVRGKATLELLCYHEYGRGKYQALGLPYPMTAEAAVTRETYAAVRAVFAARGFALVDT